MWCQNFISDYVTKSADKLSVYYDEVSVLIESHGDGWWTAPTKGVQNIVNRLTELDLTAGEWPLEMIQRTRSGGILVVLVSVNDGARQIIFVHPSPRTIVYNHFYLAAGNGDTIAMDDANYGASFPKRFGDWAASLDYTTLERHRESFCIGMAITRNYFASPAKRPVDKRARWRQYDLKARFTCSKNGKDGCYVHIGPQSIQLKYRSMLLDYQNVKLQSIETCSSTIPAEIHEPWSFVLVVGTVPRVIRPDCRSVVQKFVQFFVIDDRKRKILNDVLCFGFPVIKSATTMSLSDIDIDLTSPSSSRSRSPLSSESSLYRTPSSSSASGNRLSSSSSMMSDGYYCSSATEGSCTTWDDNTKPTDNRIALRTRLVAQTLMAKTRIANATATAATQKTGEQKPYVTSNKLNPRQLFIGCVPLNVRYGQLKLLFEQFGEVTYVKVYEGFNKQTGAKMLHNYAFLFFKDEASVEKAIAASPIPLDSNWSLNVSRPHQHYTNVR